MDKDTMVAVTLKPCPFCGFDAVVPVCVYHPYGYAIGCVKCRAKGPSYKADNAAEIPPDAITAWNARHQSEGRTGARDIFDREPSLVDHSPEPSLRRLVRKYYNEHFNAVRAEELTARYLAALSQSTAGEDAHLTKDSDNAE